MYGRSCCLVDSEFGAKVELQIRRWAGQASLLRHSALALRMEIFKDWACVEDMVLETCRLVKSYLIYLVNIYFYMHTCTKFVKP